jgi:DNA-binding NarL/FixJ family response regulator
MNGANMTAKVLVVDDHEAARLGIAEVLTDHGFEVVDQVENGRQAVTSVQSQRVDVVVLDVRMPSGDGLAALETLRSTHQDLPIVVMSGFDNPTYIARAAALGAVDYVLKNGQSNKICESLRCAIDGESPPKGSLLTDIRAQLSPNAVYRRLPDEYPLSRRESQVLAHVAFGLSNKEISRSLEISVETVKEHVQNVLRKIKATDRTDAAVRAVRMGIVQ